MEPKEKAFEIVKEFMKILTYTEINVKEMKKHLPKAKLCAFLTTKEVIEELDKGRHKELMTYIEQRSFWQKVQKEINELK